MSVFGFVGEIRLQQTHWFVWCVLNQLLQFLCVIDVLIDALRRLVVVGFDEACIFVTKFLISKHWREVWVESVVVLLQPKSKLFKEIDIYSGCVSDLWGLLCRSSNSKKMEPVARL